MSFEYRKYIRKLRCLTFISLMHICTLNVNALDQRTIEIDLELGRSAESMVVGELVVDLSFQSASVVNLSFPNASMVDESFPDHSPLGVSEDPLIRADQSLNRQSTSWSDVVSCDRAEIPRRINHHAVPHGALTTDQTLRILSLRGGGARVFSTLRWLEQLETATGRPCAEMFHVIGGTSAGAMAAAALATGHSAAETLHFMRKNHANIFKRNWWGIGGLIGPKYRSSPLAAIAHEILGDRLHTQTNCDLLIMTYDTVANRPKIFKSWETDEIFMLRDVVLASGAPPSYLAPKHILPVGSTHETHMGYTLIDGGVVANDPIACVITEAMRRYSHMRQFDIVSIGTGDIQKPNYFLDIKGAGLFSWSSRLLDIFMAGQTAKDDLIVDTLFPNYSCWNPMINPADGALDDASERNIENLILAADTLIHNRRHDFSRLVKRLVNPKDDVHAQQKTHQNLSLRL